MTLAPVPDPPPAPGGSEDAAPDSVPTAELAGYARGCCLLTGRWVPSALWLDEPYYRLMREQYAVYGPRAEAAARDLAAGRPEVAAASVRRSILGIGGYQVWDSLLRDDRFAERISVVALTLALLGCAFGTVLYLDDPSLWSALVATPIAVAVLAIARSVVNRFRVSSSSGQLSVAAAQAASMLSSRALRIALGVLALAVVGLAGWMLHGRGGVLGAASMGLFVAIGVLSLVWLVVEVARLAVRLTYRYTWRTFTVDEVVESLASAASPGYWSVRFRSPSSSPRRSISTTAHRCSTRRCSACC